MINIRFADLLTCANILSVPAWKAGSKEDSNAVLNDVARAPLTVSL